MKKKKTIIISISVAAIVVMLLLGLTYAYYLTIVNENTNTKSVASSTRNLELSWGDGNGTVSATDVAPNSSSSFATKTFTIKNDGAANKYTVVVESPYIYTGTTVTNNAIFDQNAFRYTLSCSGTSSKSVSTKTTFPITGGAILEAEIPASTTHSCTLSMFYIDTGKSQNSDMGKNFQAKLNVRVPDYYIGNANYLSFKAYNNALYNAFSNTGTKYKATPTSTPGYDSAMGTERDMSSAYDGIGTGTSYYYRGAVDDNYVNFANKCWRIVRIEGDGAVKLVLEDGYYECNSNNYRGDWHVGRANYGYETVNSQNRLKYTTSDSATMGGVLQQYLNTYLSSYTSYLKSDNWCIDTTGQNYSSSSFTYSVASRVDRYSSGSPTFSCPSGKSVTGTIGALTADEAAYAGAVYNLKYNYHYLINDYSKNNGENFLTLSPYNFASSNDRLLAVSYQGHLGDWPVTQSLAIRPAVTLKKTAIAYTGNGTKADPYRVTGY